MKDNSYDIHILLCLHDKCDGIDGIDGIWDEGKRNHNSNKQQQQKASSSISTKMVTSSSRTHQGLFLVGVTLMIFLNLLFGTVSWNTLQPIYEKNDVFLSTPASVSSNRDMEISSIDKDTAKPINDRNHFISNDDGSIFVRYEDESDRRRRGGKHRQLKVFLEPPQFLKAEVQPLPVRNVTAQDLTEIPFPNVLQGPYCDNLTARWPIDEDWPSAGLNSNRNEWINHWSKSKFFINQDTFLPWIHDVFPLEDGTAVRFIAQNKRRCHTGDGFEPLMKQMEPQVALFQGVPLMRLHTKEGVRYKLTNHDNADPDANLTRFICRFSSDSNDTIYETVSRFLWNYEIKSIGKMAKLPRSSKMFEEKGKDNGQFWISTLVFECPIPENLQQIVATGSSILESRTSLFVDIIPIRTPTRTYHYISKYPWNNSKGPKFDANKSWGYDHVLPEIQSSGRWENIPICTPPITGSHMKETKYNASIDKNNMVEKKKYIDTNNTAEKKKYDLVACTWTSSSYRIRGKHGHTLYDGVQRLLEWIIFHLLAGFDHIYVYDNSKAFDSNSSLAHITDLFPERVTRIDWPCKVCNNFKPANSDPGERSSQYAAEASCLNRYGRETEWLASMDIDEYFIPVKSNKSMKDVVNKADEDGIKILTFGSLRSKLREDASMIYVDRDSKSCSVDQKIPCLKPKNTILQAYNCESVQLPKPDHAYRAQKQIYKPSYVNHHFVHYSTIHEGYDSLSIQVNERKVDELNEAMLIHAKTVTPEQSVKREKECKTATTCNVGYPWPNNVLSTTNIKNATNDYYYNCFINHEVEQKWVPLLENALKQY